MIRHVVLFQFDKPEESYLKIIELELLNLAKEIPEIMHINVGLNDNPDEKYHLCLTVDVANYEALKSYSTHPKHLAVGAIIRKKVSHRACVDYQL